MEIPPTSSTRELQYHFDSFDVECTGKSVEKIL